MNIQASIIILTYNNLEYTRKCLDSVYRHTDGLDFEVVVVDNASSDGTRVFLQDLVKEYPNLRLIFNHENQGFARGNNLGAAEAKGDCIVFLNNDVIVTKGWLKGLIGHLQDDEIGMVGPVTNSSGNESRIEVDYTDPSDIDAFAERYTRAHRGQAFQINMLPFLCVALPMKVFKEVGPLDERFGVGMFEDDDYALRLKQKGYKILCAEDVYVHHFGGMSFNQLGIIKYWKLFAQNREIFEKKWGVSWQPNTYRTELIPKQMRQFTDGMIWLAEAIEEMGRSLDKMSSQIAERDQYIMDILNSRSWRVGRFFARLLRLFLPIGSLRERFARKCVHAFRVWLWGGFGALFTASLAWLLRTKVGSSIQVWFIKSLPSSLQRFYTEYRREYPLIDKSEVVLYADPAINLTYTPRCSLDFSSQPEENRASVSLISTVRNEAQSVKAWFDSLLLQTRLPDEVVIVDGGSMDSTVEILKEYAQSSSIPIRVIDVAEANIARGRNIAIQNARHPIVVCTDFGCMLDRDWLRNLVRPFEIDEELEVSAGFYKVSGKNSLEKVFAHFFIMDLAEYDPGSFLPSSRSLAMRKTFWARVGGYPEWLSDAGEDTLFDFQAKKLSAKWAFVPQAIVSWRPPTTILKMFKVHYRYSRGDGEAGTLASHYWKKAEIQLGLVLSLGAFLLVGSLSVALLGRGGWIVPLSLLVYTILRIILQSRMIANAWEGSMSEAFYYELFSWPIRFVQLLGFSRGVADRQKVIKRQAEYYFPRLKEILAHYPDREDVVIYPPTHDWSFMFQRPQQMARAFARKGYLFFYCTNNEKTDEVAGFQEVEPYLVVCHVPLETFQVIENPIMYLGSAWHRPAVKLLTNPRVIYDHYDDLEVSAARPEEHASLLDTAQVVVVTSHRLVETVEKTRPDVVFAPNGVDYDYIQKFNPRVGQPLPPDLSPLLAKGCPLIGYSGALAEWFDYELLFFLARRQPDWLFVLMGVSYDGSLEKSGLLKQDNVYWLGLKAYDQIFHYMWRFDVAMIPFVVNTITQATSPIKLFEYMACRKPVVSTALPEAMCYPGVFVAQDHDQFAEHLMHALTKKNDEVYLSVLDQVAQENTWATRADVILKAVGSLHLDKTD